MATSAFHDEDVLGKAYDARLMRRLLRYLRPYRWQALGAILLLCLEGALQLVSPWLTQQVIDVAVPARDTGFVVLAASAFVLTAVVQFGVGYADTMLTTALGQGVMHDLRMEIFGKLQRLPIAFFDRNPAGRLITRVTSDVEALNELFTAGVVAGIGDLFTLLAIAVMMLVIDWRLAVASFLVLPLLLVVSHLFRVRVREAYRDIRTRLARINAFLQERITGMRIVQLFGRERHEAGRFAELNAAHLSAHLRSITVYALYFPAVEFLTTVALAVVLVTGAQRVASTTLTVGVVAAFLQLLRRFFEPLQDLSEKYNILQAAMASSERVFRLLDEPDAPGTVPIAAGRAATIAPAPSRTAGERARGVRVEFDDVWFAYDRPHDGAARAATSAADGHDAPAPEWVLKGVSFRAEPGRTTALVGHTGAGKTTIISLLLRFYEPQRGRILIDGREIRDIPLDELRGIIGYVQQDIFLFAADVRTNIRLSSALSDRDVEIAASRVGADRIVRRLPGGYDEVLAERGASVSVGERQLLSFARAIAADPRLLLLDEATSAVDSEIEAEIQRALSVLMAGRTTIAVAHRLSTIVAADEILVLHHGEIVERGRHRELLARAGLYERLYRLQASGEIAPHAVP